MGYKLAILSLVAVHALTAAGLPPCVCTRNLQPVCGSDGQTYSNHCLLDCEIYRTGKQITVKSEGSCEAAEAICVCTFEYKPVCGNDGNTYPNRCSLLCKRTAQPYIDVASEGACEEGKVPQPPCICTDEIDFVCGSDGNTYSNPCQLNCATANNPSLSIKSHSKCIDKVQVATPILPQQPPCTCTDPISEVCGSDGNTYDNACVLNCATANNPSLSIKSYSKCIDKVQVATPILPQQPPCTCTDPISEVCGSDGNTYDNACVLNCATANDPSLSIKSHSRCPDELHVVGLPPLPQAPPCICTEELDEVCGSDGTTYSNPCLLNCATARYPSLSIKSRGPCANAIQGDQPSSCSCPRNMKPVCGTDGVTYGNECLLRCAGGQVSLARKGPCCPS